MKIEDWRRKELEKIYINMFILEEIKERGVTDGVAGFKGILEQVYPKTIHQRCIVHIIRNMCKCVTNKEREELCRNLKTIYKANSREETLENVASFKEKWKANKILIKRITRTNWSIVLNELIELFGERIEKYIEI